MSLRKMSASAALFLALTSTGLFAADNTTNNAATAAPAAPATQPVAPATQPIDPALVELTDQLGDADPATREAAMKKLADLGRKALPALKESSQSGNPEIRSRSRRLVRQAERRLPPAAPARDGIASTHSVSMSITDGEKTVDVNDNGYRIKIRQAPTGIRMEVTGVEEGKEVTETYKAIDADELKRDNPEAFALYEKYNQGGNGGVMVFGGNGIGMNGQGGRVRIQVNGNAVGGGQINVGPATQPAPGQPAIPMPQIELPDIRLQIEQQLDQQGVPEEHRQRVREMLDRVQKQREDLHEKAVREQEERKQEKKE